MKTWIFRLAFGLVLGLVGLMFSVALARADTLNAAPTIPATPAAEALDCASCHASFVTAVAGGSHGAQATAGFKAAWEKQGSPQACLSCHTLQGMTCATCHPAVQAGHPLAPVSVSRSPEQCGECHRPTYLGWQVSQHGRQNMTCVDCHDPHAVGQQMKGELTTLCANCHKNSEANFAHKAHVPLGLTCSECHLTQPGTPLAPHTMRDHTFAVKVETCNACHTSRALVVGAAAGGDLPALTPTPVDSLASGLTPTVSETPQPVGPLGFALLAVVLGFGAGLIVAPWVERWYQRSGKLMFKH